MIYFNYILGNKRLCFWVALVCLLVCLYICKKHYLKFFERIAMSQILKQFRIYSMMKMQMNFREGPREELRGGKKTSNKLHNLCFIMEQNIYLIELCFGITCRRVFSGDLYAYLRRYFICIYYQNPLPTVMGSVIVLLYHFRQIVGKVTGALSA